VFGQDYCAYITRNNCGFSIVADPKIVVEFRHNQQCVYMAVFDYQNLSWTRNEVKVPNFSFGCWLAAPHSVNMP